MSVFIKRANVAVGAFYVSDCRHVECHATFPQGDHGLAIKAAVFLLFQTRIRLHFASILQVYPMAIDQTSPMISY